MSVFCIAIKLIGCIWKNSYTELKWYVVYGAQAWDFASKVFFTYTIIACLGWWLWNWNKPDYFNVGTQVFYVFDENPIKCILSMRLMFLKEQCHEMFDLWDFHESVPWVCIPLKLFRSSRCTTSVIDTSGKWKKFFHHKSFTYFVWTPLWSRVNL